MKAQGVPKWNTKRKHWRLSATIDGQRYNFYSNNPSPRLGPAECRKKLEEAIELADFEKVTFNRAWAEYLDYYRKKFKLTSARHVESRGKAHLLPAFKRHKLADITKREWQAVINRAYINGANSATTLKGIANTITPFCKWASAMGYLPDDRVPLYFNYPTNKRSKTKTILQPHQLALLLSPEHDHDNWYMPMWRFLLLTGIRRGELCALQFQRDYDGEQIQILESINHDQIITDGKTAQANRHLYLGQMAKQAIALHEENLKVIQHDPDKRKYLFTNHKGQRISPRVLRNNWQDWREKHEINITLHELRHSYISYSRLKTEIDIEELKQLYGHSRATNTDTIYVHAIDESPKEKRERLAKNKANINEIESAIMALYQAFQDFER